jgi:DNA-directed RNA polymerase II subunit RPB1
MALPNFTHTSRVNTISFYVLGTEENQDDSNVTVTNKELFKSFLPISEGCYDAHMGTTDHGWLCETCGNVKTVCPGHVGSIDLNYPVKNPLFREQLMKWLKVICFDCGKLVVEKPMKVPKAKLLTEHVKIARTITKCPHCKAVKPAVSKDKYANSTFMAEYTDEAGQVRSEIIFNHEIQQIVNRISNDTVRLMGKPTRSHPKKFILSTIRVAPNTIRPDIRRMGGNRSNNSDITALTKNIVEINEVIPDEIPSRDRIPTDLQDMYYNLDSAYYELVKGSTGSGNQLRILTNTNKVPNSLANRIPKKEGRIRKNLLGKRVRHMMRSVITGDNLIKVDEVGIPMSIAMDMSIPEVVRPYNRARLTTYYMNRNTTYPGCRGIIKKSDGIQYNIKYLDESYELQDGDTVFRHIIDGDVIAFNRQPSLLYRNISCHKVRVLSDTSTFRLNVSACVLYNADFDGDAMASMLPRNIQSINEISKLSSVGRWAVSYQNSAAEMGCFQDSLIGIAEFTKNGVNLNKWHAMTMFSQVDVENLNPIDFNKSSYTSREIISMALPHINYTGKKPQIYMSQYAPFIKYKPDEIRIDIDRGTLTSGILDKATVGQGKPGSIFHIINNEYGADVMLNTIYSFQQIATRFFLYSGFTTGPEDIKLSDESIDLVKKKTAAMILESYRITESLNSRKLIPPIGTSLIDYYEMLQMNALEPGDDFVEPIFADIDFDRNKLMRMVATGSKGKLTDIIAINGAIGSQTIAGRRPLRNFSWGRTSPYFTRYDTEPRSLGYISNSYKEGIPSDVFPFATGEARHGSISNALSTSITGHQNRLSVKNLESIIVDNLRKASKPQAMIQPLYAESGLDPRKTEKVKFPTVKISHAEMQAKFHTIAKDSLPEKFHNSDVQAAFDAEYEQLVRDRELYRQIFMAIEDGSPGQTLLDDTSQMPVNVYRIIEDVVYNYKAELKDLPAEKKTFDPIIAIKKVNQLCETLPYAYYNDIQEKKKMPIPTHISTATTLLQILIRSHLCTSNMLEKGIGDMLLDIIMTRVKITFKKSLIDYGTSVGIIAAQCVSEPMTQYVLDSKHRVGGGGGTKTNTITRIKEIMGARKTAKMKNPSMLIMVPKEFETNKSKVQEIANHIEMMKFKRFIHVTSIFFERYGKPVHSRYRHEEKMISDFEKYNVGIRIPIDLSSWCIRFELNKEEMIINSMKLETIVGVLRHKHPDMFFVYTSENAPKIIIRCYLRQILIKPAGAGSRELFVLELTNRIKNMVIRGVKGIKSTNVISISKSKIQEDGSIVSHNIFGIDTIGSNLEAILENPYVDPYRTQCDSILEFETIYGIEAARNKVVHELRATMSTVSKVHTTIYADEMSFPGQITSIQRTGLQQREMSNVTLRLSFQSPIQVIENAATDGLVDKISGVAGPLIMGTVPKVGTLYNEVLVNENFLAEMSKRISTSIDDEL